MAGLIPQAFIDELIERTSLVELIDSHVPLKKRGNSYIACCPFHNEKTPSFNVSDSKQFYHCFGCGASGNAISFLMAYLHLGFIDAVEQLAGIHHLDVPRDEQQKKQHEKTKDLYQLMAQVSDFYEQTLKASKEAVAYLKERGLSGKTAKDFALGYAPDNWHVLMKHFANEDKLKLISTGMLIEKEDGSGCYDRYRGRIMFPIHDRRGRVVGFGGRVLDKEAAPKYLNSPETALFHKGRELYGLHQALKQPNTHLYIVEGYMDVIALAQHGIKNVVATLGTATTEEHIQRLSRHVQKLYFCFDGDKAGEKAAWRALEQCFKHLDDAMEFKFMFLPQGEDPDSLVRKIGKEAFIEKADTSSNLTDFFFNTLLAQVDITSSGGRSQLIAKALPFIRPLVKSAYKEILLDNLARYTRVDKVRVEAIIAGARQRSVGFVKQQPLITPLRLVLALLVQEPSLLHQLPTPVSENLLQEEEFTLLREIVMMIEPEMKTAQLIERFRQSEYLSVIMKLATFEHHVPADGLKEELVGALAKLEKHSLERQIQVLLQKANSSQLNKEERTLLQEMIKETKRERLYND